MGFNSLYGKMLITEKYCLSFPKKTERGQIKSASGYNFIASGVVTKIHCNLCNKQRCVFSSESYLSLSGEKYLEDDIYSCRMLLDSHNLCTQRNLHCTSPIENAFYFKKEIAECISVHFGSLDVDAKAMIHLRKSFKNEQPASKRCKSEEKSETCLNQGKKFGKRTWVVDFDDISESDFAEKKTLRSITKWLNKKSEEPVPTVNPNQSMEPPAISIDQPTC